MALILPQGKQKYFANDGTPLVGGRLWTFAAGTNTPKATYADSAGTTPNTNPIILDARGEALVYWDSTSAYKVRLEDSLGNAIWTVDNIQAASSGSSATGISVIVGNGITDTTAAVQAANALGLPIYFLGLSVISSPTTITVPILNGYSQIFTPTSQVTISGQDVLPDWFGSATGNIMLAVNALPVTGGVVRLADKSYPPSYSSLTAAKVVAGTGVAGVDYMAKANVKIVGAKLPNYKAPVAGVIPALEGGTIIQGPFFVQAKNFEHDLFGVDSGPDTCTALYAGVAQEGFMVLQANQLVPSFNGGYKGGKVVGLCKGAAELVHSVLIEALTDGSIEEATGAQSFHGVVIKSQNIKAGILRGLETGGEGVICKSDAYAPMGPVQIDQVEASSIDGTVDNGFGFLVDAVGATASSVEVGSVRTYRKSNGMAFRSNGNILSDVIVGSFISDGCPIAFLISGDVRRTHVGGVIANNSTYGAQVEPTVTSATNSIGSLKVTNATNGIQLGGRLSVADLSVENITGFALNYYDTAARLVLSSYRPGGSVAAFWPLQPGALTNSWVNEGSAGAPTFRVSLDGGRVRLSGRIKSGTAAQVLAALSVQIRPTEDVSVKISGLNGATQTTATLQVVSSTGQIVVPDYAASPTWVQLEASWPIPV